MAVDSPGKLHVATTGLESFSDTLQSCSKRGHSCSNIAISPEGCKFMTYFGMDEARLKILKPNGDLLATIHKLHVPRGVFIDQSGNICRPQIRGCRSEDVLKCCITFTLCMLCSMVL